MRTPLDPVTASVQRLLRFVPTSHLRPLSLDHRLAAGCALPCADRVRASSAFARALMNRLVKGRERGHGPTRSGNSSR